MAADRPEPVQIGFSGGQALSLRLTERELADLRKAIQKGSGWHEATLTEGGMVSLDTSQVVFIRSESTPHRIGFGSSS